MTTDEVAIVGVGTTPFDPLYRERQGPRSAYDLAAQAFSLAVADAGIDKSEIDGLFTARVPSYIRMADVLGLRRPRVCNGFDGAGRMSGVAVQLAAAAISAGMADTIALVYGNNGRSAGATYGGESPSPTEAYDVAYGMTSPGAWVALMYQRYAQLHGVPDGALAPFAINNRNHAMRNPEAVMRTPLTEEDYASSRFVAEPLRLYDYCLINDGGVALIMTSTKRARELGGPVVTIASTAAAGDLTNYYASDDNYFASCRSVADEVYRRAGIGHDQIDCAQIYDNFTPTIVFSLEGFGFCDVGEGWRWGPENFDRMPINTSGGHTSESYMQGWALHAEAVRQLRGTAGERQVPGCEHVQYMCAAPIVSSHILRRLA